VGATTCASATAAKATDCIDGFYNNNADTNNCRACGWNVKKCTATSITSCKDGYFVSGTSCVACPGGAS